MKINDTKAKNSHCLLVIYAGLDVPVPPDDALLGQLVFDHDSSNSVLKSEEKY